MKLPPEAGHGHASIERALRCHQAFARWPDALLHELAAASRMVRYRQGARVCRPSDNCPEACVLVSGRLLLVSSFGGSREEIVGLLGPHMIFGDLMRGTAAALSLGCVAVGAAVVVHIQANRLCELLDSEHERWGEFSRMLLAQETTLLHTLIGQVTGSVSQRVAQTLLQYTVLHGMRAGEEGGGDANLHLSQDDLGTLLHLSRKTIGKELRQLEELGLIVCGYSLISIPSVHALSVFTGAEQARPVACGCIERSATVRTSGT